jgi:hypothetical protein
MSRGISLKALIARHGAQHPENVHPSSWRYPLVAADAVVAIAQAVSGKRK